MTDQSRPRLDHGEGDPTDQPFRMPVEDVRVIAGQGIRVSGRIESGAIHMGATVEAVGPRRTALFTVTGIAAMRAQLERAQAGDIVDILLRSPARHEVDRGDVLTSPGTIGSHA
jgi:elongation factor Tu